LRNFAFVEINMDSLITILYALPVYQCMVLAVLLIKSRSETGGSSRLIFGLFNSLLAVYFAFNLLYRLKAFHLIAYLYYPILPVILCFIPTFYLYILSVTTNNFRFMARHAIHFFPAAVILLLNTPFLLMPFGQKIEYLSFAFVSGHSSPQILYLLIIYLVAIYLIINIQLVSYLVLTIRQYRQHLSFIQNHYSNTEQVDTSWTRSFMISFLIFFIINNLLYVIGFRQHPVAGILYTVSMLGITLFAGVRGLNQKEIAVEITAEKEEIPPESEEKTGPIPEDSLPESGEVTIRTIKYQGSPLTDEQKQVLAEKLESLMESEKIFLQSNLTIDHLAQRLDTNSKYISQIINEFYHQNYYHYINSFRINEAKLLLTYPANDKYSILGISNMAGFASKSTFNTAFRKFTGITPSEFRDKRDKSLSKGMEKS
jgi:AraC-like DNA-binding protein